MKNELNAIQQKIYEDKAVLPDNELLEIINNPEKYLANVVYVAKVILDERQALPDEFNGDVQLENNLEASRIKYTVAGPPYEKGFKRSSMFVIIASFFSSLMLKIVPDEEGALIILFCVLVLVFCIWATVIASNYLRKINWGQGFAVLCFFAPLIGLIIVRNLNYKIQDPNKREIFARAKAYYDLRIREIRDNQTPAGTTREDMIDELRESVDAKLNSNLAEEKGIV